MMGNPAPRWFTELPNGLMMLNCLYIYIYIYYVLFGLKIRGFLLQQSLLKSFKERHLLWKILNTSWSLECGLIAATALQ